ncbi:hypothetical protein GCM10009839_50030 [Catenulispora yoronensis]|uniref:Uncharacterized protein n=1 Tax=Catenulispora yoronensis TaxID=450799 RepID=A0ABN2USM7_9ACTN
MTAAPSPQPTPTPTATPTPTPTPTSTPTATATATAKQGTAPVPAPGAAAVVTAFYAAINAQNYATAWQLGGDNLGFTYDAFAAGFAGTAHDTLTITGVQGNTVQVHLEALQSDGSTKVYEGFYVVQNGAIVEGRLTQLATSATSGIPRRGEYCPDADAGQTAKDDHGNTLTCVLENGRFHWH